ncbi:hypothetical protein LguiA_026948 [Lonicera macranthoides]
MISFTLEEPNPWFPSLSMGEFMAAGAGVMATAATVCSWIDGVRKIEVEVDELNKKYEKENSENRRSTLNLTQLTDILVKKESEPVVKMKAPDITEFLTLQKLMEYILAFLTNDKVKDGENLSTGQLQQALVRRLKLNVKGSSDVNEVASVIREELTDKKYLLLLDDVKEDLELDQIGIDLNDENGSKILLTTTVDGVCNSIVDKAIDVKRLTLGEAWKMFKNIVNQNLNRRVDQCIERIMYQIVKYCGGLIGGAM